MTDSLAVIVYFTELSFPTGQPSVDDIRFAATVDGYDMTKYTTRQIMAELFRQREARR